MYYSISDVSKQLKISKVTIYKKIDKINELKKHVKQLKEGKCITAEGLEIIKQSLLENQYIKPLQEKLKGEGENQEELPELTVYKQLIGQLENQIIELKSDKENLYNQLDIKDKQIESLTRLNENAQVLLNQQQEKILLLKEPRESFWSKLKRK